MPTEVRVAVRIVLLDPSSRVLLLEGRDLSDMGDTVRFWFTAGGGVHQGESLMDAGERELLEETGQSGLRGPFHRREFDFLNHGEPQRQVEHFFAARTTDTTLTADGWTELEHKAMTTWRWWTTEDLGTEDVQIFPENLGDLVRQASDLVLPQTANPWLVLVERVPDRRRPIAVRGPASGTSRVPAARCPTRSCVTQARMLGPGACKHVSGSSTTIRPIAV
jgi:ADP-ribose pyrophosphatase YjhB (NUDIX family)